MNPNKNIRWNYRVMEDNDNDYGIHSVYYNQDKSEVIGFSEHPMPPHGATTELLKEDLLLMMAAFNRETLYAKDYKEEAVIDKEEMHYH